MAIRWLDRVLGRETTLPPQQTTNPHMRALTSPTYETHVGVIDLEEASKRSSKAKGPQNLSMAWDDSYTGVPGVAYRDGLMSEKDRKDTYYKAYINNAYVSGSVDVIAKRITSGGWNVEEVEQGKGNVANQDSLKQLLLYVNDDEDFSQFLRSIATDLLIYGEAYCEIVYQSGIPYQLHKIDCCTMTTHLDKHGSVLGYTQTLDKSNDIVTFEPDQVIRWWLPDPRANKKALSPIERIKDAVYLYQAMTAWSTLFFKQGARPSFTVEMGPDSNLDEAQRYIKFYKENYTGLTNAHVPNVAYGGSKIVEFGHGSVDMDFIKGRDKVRDEILTGYGVPPALVGVIESGNIGGGTGESQEKSFQYNTVDPIRQVILEKLNYRLQAAFGIDDWVITTRYADYRNDEVVSRIQDQQIKNGSRSINEIREEHGHAPLDGGDEAVIVMTRIIEPVQRLKELADEERQQTLLTIKTAQNTLQQAQQQPQQQPSQGGNAPVDKQDDTGTQPANDAGDASLAKESTVLWTTDVIERLLADKLAGAHTSAPRDGLLHWQDGSEPTQAYLEDLQAQGVETITWKNHLSACDQCAANHEQMVPVGTRFKSGAYLPPEHANCTCDWIDNEGNRFTWDGVEGAYSLEKKDGGQA